MRVKKRWLLGSISGFFLGLFLDVVLIGFGVVRLDSAVLSILPWAGLVLGLALALWGPITPPELRAAGAGAGEAAGAAGPGAGDVWQAPEPGTAAAPPEPGGAPDAPAPDVPPPDEGV
jgi:hypothetical protein